MITKSPKGTPLKLKKSNKEYLKKKDEVKEERMEINTANEPHQIIKDSLKDTNEIQKDISVKEIKEVKETLVSAQLSSKESKRTKKKNDILAVLGKLVF